MCKCTCLQISARFRHISREKADLIQKFVKMLSDSFRIPQNIRIVDETDITNGIRMQHLKNEKTCRNFAQKLIVQICEQDGQKSRPL